jgi:hypothetical protein
MSKQDEWGYTHINLNMIRDGKKIFNTELISYKYSENDGYSYMNHGAQRKIIIDIDKMVDTKLLEVLIEKIYFPDNIVKIFKDMILKNRIISGEYSDEKYW